MEITVLNAVLLHMAILPLVKDPLLGYETKQDVSLLLTDLGNKLKDFYQLRKEVNEKYTTGTDEDWKPIMDNEAINKEMMPELEKTINLKLAEFTLDAKESKTVTAEMISVLRKIFEDKLIIPEN